MSQTLAANQSFLSLDTRSPLGLLTLLQFKGIGNQTARSLVVAFTHLELVLTAAKNGTIRVNQRIRSALATLHDWQNAHDGARRILDKSIELGVRITTLFDADYPELLKHVPNGPVILYTKGQIKPDGRYVTCAGTREPSDFGLEATTWIVQRLVERGWGIVSGLAKGIDRAAHTAALSCGGHTIAILGNGLDTIFPKENRALAQQILAQGGALVSELSFGVKPSAPTLIQATRLQSGFSIGTFVMQTDLVGGTIHTLMAALRQRRPVFVPVPLEGTNEVKSRGNVAFVTKSGTELSGLISATPQDRAMLKNRFYAVPIAVPVHCNEDCNPVWRKLEDAYAIEQKSSLVS